MNWITFLLPKLDNFFIGIILIVVGVSIWFFTRSWSFSKKLTKITTITSFFFILAGVIVMFLFSWIEKIFANIYLTTIFLALIIIVGLGCFLFKNDKVVRRKK